MNTGLIQRPKWDIDRALERLIGHDVRIAAESFAPASWNGQPSLLRPTRELVLPDGGPAAGLPVYFEGRLKTFRRDISVVYATLDAPTLPQATTEGIVPFRGGLAAILRGPATVKLASPFRVEALPSDADNYWSDLRVPRVQFKLPL